MKRNKKKKEENRGGEKHTHTQERNTEKMR